MVVRSWHLELTGEQWAKRELNVFVQRLRSFQCNRAFILLLTGKFDQKQFSTTSLSIQEQATNQL